MLALALVAAAPATSPAQAAQRRAEEPSRRPRLLGTPDDVRRRDGDLLGATSTEGSLLRSASRQGGLARRSGIVVLAPDLRVVSNGAIPFSLNDGAMWAGRGWSALVRAGLDARAGRVRVLLMPELTASQNRAFDFRADARAGRSVFAWPWGAGRADIDLPSRFGDRAWRLVSPGQSSITVDVGPLALGVSTENDWWGPGVRNALVMSNNAEGFPHALVRTRRPVRTAVGDVELSTQLGILTPSLYVDSAPRPRWRAISAVAATLRVAGVPELTVGVSRAVVAAVASRGAAGGHALDALVRVQRDQLDSTDTPAFDQIASVFGRWVIPRAGAELYGEFARQGVPRSLREILVAPQAGGAITLGVRALRPLGTSGRTRARVEVELTSVEQSVAFRDRPTPRPFYTGVAARDGYTHRGQVLGAAIGPGSSSQWLATDVVRRRAEAGIFVGRTRWNNDVLYTQPNANFFRHDVSTYLGARGTLRTRLADFAAEGYWARRYNYLFQNGSANPGGRRTVDVTNVTSVLTITPR